MVAQSNALDEEVDMLRCCLCSDQLQRPLLLGCLHSCCDRCADGAAVDAAASASGSSIVVCPLCNEATDVGTKYYNSFIQSRLLLLQVIDGQAACGFCDDGDADGAAGGCGPAAAQRAEKWCPECRKFLCADCSPQHKRILKHHAELWLTDVASKGKLLLDAVTCPRHVTNAQDFVCTDCQTLGCHACARACIQAGHGVLAVGVLTEQYVSKVKESIGSLKRQLESKAAMFQSYDCLLGDLDAARRATLDELRANKRRLLDVVDVVFVEAEEMANSMYDDVFDRASEMVRKAHELKGTVHSSIKYSNFVLDVPEVSIVLQQHKLLLSRLSKLASSLKGMSGPAATSGVVKLQSAMPTCLDEVLKQWLGQPVMRPDFNCDTIWKEEFQKGVFLGSSTNSAVEYGTLADATCLRKEVGPAVYQLSAAFDCHDLAFSSNGRLLLLAAGVDGLLEVNITSRKQTQWLPATTDGKRQSVVSVASLADGSVVVSLDHLSCAIVSNRTNNGQWHLERYITALQKPFFSLSAYGNLAAAAEGMPGIVDQASAFVDKVSAFVVVSLFGDGMQVRQPVDCCIKSLALTADAVVITSRCEERFKSGRYAWTIDGYAFSGSRLWTIEHQYRTVLDAWVADGGEAIYLLVETGKFEIVSIDQRQGQRLAELTLSPKILQELSPMKLSSGLVPYNGYSGHMFAFLAWNRRELFLCRDPL